MRLVSCPVSCLFPNLVGCVRDDDPFFKAKFKPNPPTKLILFVFQGKISHERQDLWPSLHHRPKYVVRFLVVVSQIGAETL